MGFVTTNLLKFPPFLYSIGEENYCSVCYMVFIINVVTSGWLRREDYVVVDNTILHSSELAGVLTEVLWHAPRLDGLLLNIVVVPSPTCAPELNSIDLCWNMFVKRLKMLKGRVLNGAGGA